MALRGILLLAIFAVSVPICFVRPIYGLALWNIVAFLNPQQYSWIPYSFPWAQIVAVPTLAGALLFSRKWGRLAKREVYLVVALWIWFTFTSIASTGTPLFQHHALDTWARWNYVSKMLLMAMIMIPVVSTFEQLRWLLMTIAGCFGFFILKALPFMVQTGGSFRLYGPADSMIADNNDFGLALNMTLPLFLLLAQTESNRWLKRLFGFLVVATIPAIFFTYSRGALVGFVAVSVMLFLHSRKRMILLPVMGVALIIALVFAPQAWKDRMDPSRPDAVDLSAKARLNSWQFAWNLASEYPVTGGGFSTFTPELFSRYAPEGQNIHGPHSVYFQVLGEHGFAGLALYLALLLSCFFSIRRLVRAARYYQDTVIMQYANTFRLSLVAFMVSGIFLGRAYFDYFFSFVAAIVILSWVARDKWSREDGEDGESLVEAGEDETVAELGEGAFHQR